MDRNQVFGLLLIFLMITVYSVFFAPEPQGPEPEKQAEAIEKTEEPTQIGPAPSSEKVDPKSLGDWAELSKGKEKNNTVENEDLTIKFSSKGGLIEEVTLKNYKTFDGKPVRLVQPDRTFQKLELALKNGKKLDLRQLYFSNSNKAEVVLESGKSAKITYRARLEEGKFIQQTYTIPSKGFNIGYQLEIKGLEDEIKNQKFLDFYWSSYLPKLESDLTYSRYYTTINYSDAEGEFNYLKWPSEEEEKVSMKQNLHWISFKQRFFSSALIAKNKNLAQGRLVKNTDVSDSSTVKFTQAFLKLPLKDLQNGKGDFEYYFGPNRYQEMYNLKVDNFDNNVYLGWGVFGSVSRYVIIPLFTQLEKAFSNYGLLIIVMVLIIKFGLLPLTFFSYRSMAKMKVMNEYLKPELDAFKEKNDLNKANLSMEEQNKVQQEQMRLYKELGSSPLAAMNGCFPLLLQMPILLSLFMFFPNAIQLRQQSFLWAHDLSTFDSILNLPFSIPWYGDHVSLFTLLMTVSTIAMTYFNSQTQANIQGPMKYMGYIFPVVFMFVLNSYPSGLSFYYLVQNVVTIGQQSFFKKFLINEDKIKTSFAEYKKKNKGKTSKKSSWQLRLEEAQKKALEAQEARRQKKDKPKAGSKHKK